NSPLAIRSLRRRRQGAMAKSTILNIVTIDEARIFEFDLAPDSCEEISAGTPPTRKCPAMARSPRRGEKCDKLDTGESAGCRRRARDYKGRKRQTATYPSRRAGLSRLDG